MVYYVKNRATNEITRLDGLKELDEFCDKNDIKSNTLFRARKENRETRNGFDLIDKSEITPRENKIKTAVIVSDIHFCYQDDNALSILYDVLEELGSDVDEFIDLGDGVNNDALSSYTCVEEETHTLYDEIDAYNCHMNIIHSILDNDHTKFVVTQDNHFHLRKRRFLAENPAMVGLIPDVSDKFDEEIPHGELYFPFGQTRFGCIHGISFADIFTKIHLNLYGRYDVLCGHTHTIQTYVSSSGTKYEPARRSYGLPCMCKEMAYTNGKPTRQVTGFSVLTYDTVSDNYNIEYVIIEDNRALFRGKIYEGRC